MGYVESNLMAGEQVTHWTKLHWTIFVSLKALLTLFIAPLVARATSEFAVTNRRVIIKVGLVSRRTVELNLEKVESIGVEQTVLGRMLGYGTIVDREGHPVTPKTPPITEADAELLLRRDMEGAARDVAARVKVPLKACEAAALISWTYNLGGGSLAKSTMLTRINAKQMEDVPAEMRKWINQEGKPLVGLLRRRWAEAAIFVGVEPANACVRAWREIDSLDDWPEF